MEEAQEEELATLINTVTEGADSADELGAIDLALKALVARDLIQLAKSPDRVSLGWSQLRKHDSLAILESLGAFLRWSSADERRLPRKGAPEVEVQLTEAGLNLARKILSEYGWDFWRKK